MATPASFGSTSGAGGVVKVFVVDDHPVMRAGLERLLGAESGFAVVGTKAGSNGLRAEVALRRPDVLVLDYSLERGNGLTTCFRIKQLQDAPAVVLYSPYIDRRFVAPAMLAQADAVVSKTDSADELLAILRRVAVGQDCMPNVEPEVTEAGCARIAGEDLAIAGMLFSKVNVPDIATVLGTSPSEVRARALRMIQALQGRERAHANNDPQGGWPLGVRE